MINITATSGNQVEGLTVSEELENKLLSGQTDPQKARAGVDFAVLLMSIKVWAKDDIGFGAAQTYEENNITRIS